MLLVVVVAMLCLLFFMLLMLLLVNQVAGANGCLTCCVEKELWAADRLELSPCSFSHVSIANAIACIVCGRNAQYALQSLYLTSITTTTTAVITALYLTQRPHDVVF